MKNKSKQGVSLVVLTITIIIMIILTTVIILSLNDSEIINESDKATLETNRRQIEDLANSAWVKAYGAGKITQQELEAEVNAALLKEKMDTDNYDVVVTEDGVTVKIKADALGE